MMPDYSKSIIYTIRSKDSIYVGSTTDFANRKYQHKSSIFKNIRNSNLYKTIRDNGYDWDMQPYKLFPCENKLELTIEEERVRQELGADLNMVCCGSGIDTNDMDYKKKIWSLYRETNRHEIRRKQNQNLTCECGCTVTRSNLPRHKKSNKHLEFISKKIIPT